MVKTKEFSFKLPKENIAQHPLPRGKSRMLVYSRRTGEVIHSQISQLCEHIPENTLLVLNNSFVRKARVFAHKDIANQVQSQVECIFLEALDEHGASSGEPSCFWRVMAKKTARQKLGDKLILPGGVNGEIIGINNGLLVLVLDQQIGMEYFAQYGHVPLPPYIRRKDQPQDETRYQNIYAQQSASGASVAAATAGLHLSRGILKSLADRGFRICYITLHVGLGTFLPVRSENVEEHRMHSEKFAIDQPTAELITEQKRRSLPLLAVGTTSLRCLESAWDGRSIRSGRSETDIFIYPGYEFKVVDALLTNFHTPESTLLMLLSAFVGREKLLALYADAIKADYRFFSYGDACLFL